MALVKKIDSNVTGLRWAEESSIGTVSGTAVWYPLEPNSYSDFGGEISTVARNPINPSRQMKKGVTTDLDASGGFNSDLTQKNLADLMQGFMFADFRRKGEFGVAASQSFSATAANTYSRAAGDFTTVPFRVGDLVFAEGFALSTANGLKRITTSAALTLTVSETVGVSTPAADEGSLVVVGFQFGTGEVDISTTGAYTTFTRASGTKDFTQFGLVPGEFIFIGGDLAAERFTNDANNGFKRVKSVTSTTIVIDKSASDMVNETGTAKTIRLFFGRCLKNENTASTIKRRTYQIERTLGAPDDSSPASLQSEYLVGAVANEFTLNIPTADKLNADLAFIAIGNEQRTAATGVKTGTRPAIAEASAFNTSSDVTRIRLSQTDTADEAPTDLFAYVTDLSLTINNNASPNKAVGVLGAFDVSVGSFMVEGSLTAYFANVDAIAAVRDNVDCTLDIQFAKDNAGIAIDIPMISIGDARANVEQDQPITLPLNVNAATGAKYDANMDYTLFFVFFDYLPSLAQ
jgi:hypothetical protein